MKELESNNFSVVELFEDKLSKHKLNNYLVEHTFIAAEDHSETLTIRPFEIMINIMKRNGYINSDFDKKKFIKEHREDILEILEAIEVENIEESFEEFTGLLFEEKIIYYVNMISGMKQLNEMAK